MNKNEFWNILHNVPPVVPVTYRLYYDEQGVPLFYSMEDVPGTYIDIDAETFAHALSQVRVRNGKIVPLTWKTTSKLVPGDTGTPCHPENVAIVVPETEPHTKWSKKTYESN